MRGESALATERKKTGEKCTSGDAPAVVINWSLVSQLLLLLWVWVVVVVVVVVERVGVC